MALTLSQNTIIVRFRGQDNSSNIIWIQAASATTLATPILDFSGRPRQNVLTLRGPRNEIVPDIDTEPRSWPVCRRTPDPINIKIRNQTINIRWTKVETMWECALQIMLDPLEGKELWFVWIMHEEADMLNSISDIRSHEGLILKGPSQASIKSRIVYMSTKA